MPAPRRPVIAVVGGGIAGLSAAWELVTSSDMATGAGPPIVHVLEADNRVGGKLDSAEFAGRTVDLAADAFLARRPEATELCEQIGVSDELVPMGTTGTSILADQMVAAGPVGSPEPGRVTSGDQGPGDAPSWRCRAEW